ILLSKIAAQRNRGGHLRAGHDRDREKFGAGFAHDPVQCALRLRIDVAVHNAIFFFAFENSRDRERRQRKAAVLWFCRARMEDDNHGLRELALQNPKAGRRTPAEQSGLPWTPPPFPSVPRAMNAPLDTKLICKIPKHGVVEILQALERIRPKAIAFLKILLSLRAHSLAVLA